MKTLLHLAIEIFVTLIAVTLFALTLAAGFGAFTPQMSPWWLIATIPTSFAIGALIAAGTIQFARLTVEKDWP